MKNIYNFLTEKYSNLLVLPIVIIFVLSNCSNDKKAAKSKLTNNRYTATSYPKTPGGENRPIISASNYQGKTALAYKIANEIPHILDKVFCYCYCAHNPRIKHKSLKSCYTDEHGANCDICQNEAIMAYELYKQGLSTEKIVQTINKRFYHPLRR